MNGGIFFIYSNRSDSRAQGKWMEGKKEGREEESRDKNGGNEENRGALEKKKRRR